MPICFRYPDDIPEVHAFCNEVRPLERRHSRNFWLPNELLLGDENPKETKLTRSSCPFVQLSEPVVVYCTSKGQT